MLTLLFLGPLMFIVFAAIYCSTSQYISHLENTISDLKHNRKKKKTRSDVHQNTDDLDQIKESKINMTINTDNLYEVIKNSLHTFISIESVQ